MAKGNNAIEENTTLMNGDNKKPDDIDETFMQFLYNKNRGTVLGRTAKSWCQITGFYIVFYAFLAAFWIACLAIFLSTLDHKVPRFYGKGTIIGVNPGLGYQPWLKENPDSTLIKYNLKDMDTAQPYVQQLEDYLSRYNTSEGTRECGPGESNADLSKEGSDARPCRFSLAPFEKDCGADSLYGFKRAKPCVVLSLNRLIGWEPLDYPDGSVPEPVKERYRKGSIAISCDGANEIDKEYVGNVKYLPPEGINGKYYPYMFVPGYQQPIAMVRFESLPLNKLVLIECRAYALNIEHDITSRLGLVHFEVFIEDKAPEKKDEDDSSASR